MSHEKSLTKRHGQADATRRLRMGAGALALMAAGALLAGCAASAPGQAAPISGAQAASPSAKIAEAGSATPRLVLTYDGGLLVADARDGAVLSNHKLAGFNRVNPAGDGRRVLVSTAGGFQVLDSGVWSEKHGEHAHHYTSDPSLTELVFPAAKPGHAVVHAGHTALFDDATGKINIFESTQLDNRALPRTEDVALPEAHHGVAVRLADGTLLVTDGNAEAVNAVKLLSAPDAEHRRTTVAESRQCPGVHGEAVAKDEAMVVGCEDGILVIKDKKIAKLEAPDAYGRIGNQAGSEVSSVVLGDYKKDKDAELERPQTFSLTDTATNTLKLIDINYSYSFRSLARSAGGDALLLGTDGKLHVYDVKNGKEKKAIAVVGAWEELIDWQQPRPTVHVSGGTAYVTEPATKELHFVDLKTGKVSRSVTLPEVPNEITSIKG
ncbi:PQQ-binding-like beta-propeller repeat protein [Paeniglutamicibacter sp. ABSL32-1]|uniref:zinc metallochaperone AztD n=1 Tax=Paeniglutamicibacter quisquiliarum TaxID=2849498 RepID=UPI001C2D451E|nr:zinc metallochaperone AztD [Paeniglutamicibacter quisquiliarum]MBV1777998.1 PQQ-binding-like beta-propeller repeat protein [Paeniglutamicibacter quisquiliarum]